jgi:hypothetical protein
MTGFSFPGLKSETWDTRSFVEGWAWGIPPGNWLKMADLGGNGHWLALLLPRHLQ